MKIDAEIMHRRMDHNSRVYRHVDESARIDGIENRVYYLEAPKASGRQEQYNSPKAKKSCMNADDTNHQKKSARSTKAATKIEEPDNDSGVEEEEVKDRTPGAAKAKASEEEVKKTGKCINA